MWLTYIPSLVVDLTSQSSYHQPKVLWNKILYYTLILFSSRRHWRVEITTRTDFLKKRDYISMILNAIAYLFTCQILF